MEAEKRHAKHVQKLGKPNESAQEWPKNKVKFTDLKKKTLNSIINIMYLNRDQLIPLSIKDALLLVFLGDFGVGKTDLLMAAARQAAEDEDNIVFLLLGMKCAKILEIKNKKLFENSAVRVVRKDPEEIEMFLQLQKEENPDKNIAVFIDEVEVSRSDKEAIMTKNTTTSLLDSTDDKQKDIKLSEEDIQTYIETQSMFK